MSERRIFLAFDIPNSVRAICNGHIENLRTRFPDVRMGWDTSEKLHITLKFLGNTESRLLDDLETRVAELAAKHPSFNLRLSRTGVFPRASRPRVLWIGLEDRPNAVAPMNAELEETCEELGWAKETRAFRPHITIGRVRDPDEAGALADLHLQSKVEPVEFEVAEIVIYESKLQSTGSVYSQLASLPLKAA